MIEFPRISDILKQYNIRAIKSLGQNFILDDNISSKIVSFAGDLADKNVIEIGPGPGTLTRHILQQDYKNFVVIEADNNSIPILSWLKDHSGKRLDIIHGDALKYNPDELFLSEEKYIIISNLPYYISSQLLFFWLESAHRCERMILLFQKELAERLTARPCTKEYGRISVLAQYLYDIELVYNLPASVFTPAPKVDSALLKFDYKNNFYLLDLPQFNKLLRAVFANRRKIIISNLKTISTKAEELLEKAHIKRTARAEELSLNQYMELMYHWERDDYQ